MSSTIGKLAKQAEVTIETIRYYQRIGLLNEPGKSRNGYRLYPPAQGLWLPPIYAVATA